ncbi:uncharacterized protein ACLA_061340 [Aspergillus clavatus NRRL 1]|uniref:Glucose-methanol-choline oxidoreductase C-terminal domain-containing protein n=1 Tax=Aspergillus clavatus (strain ATCC 1007 / CBS 513.65 / DSM 816 / NCTC 3887 / NRRL 1 / QM 1276 / 107) TaxID=344612 RepID=A1CCB5_ASPCL|nr:uncharacterized protein ACLA_061340 [Aspergillus clavatus NRRL 1]EAW12172.1 hypothetical protein ACLA_061340 [Aspergillus clavatus NRRL 1]
MASTWVWNLLAGRNDRLRVCGVDGLRIVDASVIPSQLSGNIIATVYALAERAADLIKEDALGAL